MGRNCPYLRSHFYRPPHMTLTLSSTSCHAWAGKANACIFITCKRWHDSFFYSLPDGTWLSIPPRGSFSP